MKVACAPGSGVFSHSLGSAFVPFLILALPVLGVLLATRHLWVIWATHDQYGYGWCVPAFALYSLWLRWGERPSAGRPARVGAGIFLALGMAGYAVSRWLHEAGADWRPPYLGVVLAGAMLGLGAFLWCGGWRWWRWFLFPSLFMLTAVPWPMGFELRLTNSLSLFNASVAMELLAWAGVLARRVGNVIETPSGAVGIEEACSGIRSLQTVLMLAILFGEFYRLHPGKRIFVAVASVGVALVVNLGRTLYLVFLTAHHSPEMMEKWHDSVASVALAVACGLVWLLGWLFGRGAPCANKNATADHHGGARRLPWQLIVAVFSICLAIEAAVPLWYDLRWGKVVAEKTDLTIRRPDSNRYQPFDLGRLVTETLAADSIQAVRWADDNGCLWVLYDLRWNPGNLHALPARAHTPEICLTGRSGMRLVRRLPAVEVPVTSTALPFDFYEFERNGVLWHVFFASWEHGPKSRGGVVRGIPTGGERIRSALEGRRVHGLATLELATAGHRTAGLARAAFRRELQKFLNTHEPTKSQ